MEGRSSCFDGDSVEWIEAAPRCFEAGVVERLEREVSIHTEPQHRYLGSGRTTVGRVVRRIAEGMRCKILLMMRVEALEV